MFPMNSPNPLGGAPGLPATPLQTPGGSRLPGPIPPLGGGAPEVPAPPPATAMTPQQTNRQKMMSDMLRAGATNSPEGQMVGGNYVAPSPMQNLGQLANAAGYAYANRG